MSTTTTPPSQTRLFKPLKVGNNTLQHRLVFPPLTRFRSDNDHVPLPFVPKYYADRASAPGTLIISEATSLSQHESGQRNVPAFVTDKQVEAWREVIAAVHAKGGVWFQQVWAMGRASDPEYLAERGFSYRSSSAVPMPGSEATPVEMTEEEIQGVIQDYVDTAKRIVAAGGDGIEVHSAHGYLLDQFLSDNNKRADRWGGSVENRSRLTLEVVKAVVNAVGAERVAIRLSPYAGFQGSVKSDIPELFTYLIGELKKMDAKLAYLSLVETRGDPMAILSPGDAINQGQTLDFILEQWDNLSPVLVAGGYTPQSAASAVEEHYKKWDVMVAFGRAWIANPDLVFRIRNDVPLRPYDRTTFYNRMEERGYNTWAFSDEFLKAQAEAQAVAAAAS